MKAAVLVENGRVEVEERPTPSVGAGEYLIQLRGAGVCSSDLFRGFARGAYRYPLVMGHELSGEIVERALDARRLELGQRVVVFPLLPCRACAACGRREWTYCTQYDYFGSRRDGGFQDLLAVPEWNLLAIPDELDAATAALCEPVAVAIHAANALPQATNGDVAILGAGFLGIVAGLVLKARGARAITLFDRNPFKLELARSLGLLGESYAGVEQFSDGFGMVLEACGAESTYRRSLALAAPGATVVWLGNAQCDLALKKSEVSSVLRKELHLRGVWNSSYRAGQTGVRDDWAEALAFLANKDTIDPLVSHRVELEALPDLLRSMYEVKQTPKVHGFLKALVIRNPDA